MRSLYAPSRMIVGLAGRVDDGLVGTVESLLGDLEGTPAAGVIEAAVAGPANGRVLVESKPIDQAYVCLALRAYPASHPDRYAVQLIATVLGGGMSSRLSEELTMRRGLAYTVFAVSHSHTDAGALWAQGGVNVDKVDDAITVMMDELRQLAEEPVPSEELEKARNYAKGRFAFSMETPQGIIGHGLRGEILHGRAREPEDVLAGLDAVTAADIQRVAQDLLGGGFYLSLIGPYDDPARFERLVS
jgi:predicted Zn-dependent peptidase